MNTPDPKLQPALPMHSQRLLGWFGMYGRRYTQRKFNGIRLLKNPNIQGQQIPQLPADQPVVFYLNHPSWWDPMILLTLATGPYAGRKHFAPMDEAMLRQYAFFERLGFFGIEPDSAQGAAKFLRTARLILAQPNTTLWITAQGRFVDVRQRPVELKPGLAHVARHMKIGSIIPIAVEYTFWNQSTPEALLAIGKPIDVQKRHDGNDDYDVPQWQTLLTTRLTQLMDELAAASSQRDETLFELLNTGRRGVGGIYDQWRRLKAWKQGRSFDPSHPASTKLDHNPNHNRNGASS